MNSTLLIAGLVFLGALAAVYFALSKKLERLNEDSGTRMINDNIQKMNDRLNDRLTEAARYIGSLGQELRSMQIIGKNIDDLRSVFMNSKLRGNFGEQVLNDMLSNNFPKDQFILQHKFKDGQTVDAIILTKDGNIAIDSKFPADSFRRMLVATTEEERASERNEFHKAVRKHLNDIAKKYILPGEGTANFAIMYVPSEATFYEIISGPDELAELAQRSRVLMVSPNTLSYFLHILRLGHERIRIEENVQKVWELLAGFHQETMKFGEQLSVMSRHITNAKGAMDTTQAAYERLAGKVDQIKQLQ
jgi:DNA recombination protein RmuC